MRFLRNHITVQLCGKSLYLFSNPISRSMAPAGPPAPHSIEQCFAEGILSGRISWTFFNGPVTKASPYVELDPDVFHPGISRCILLEIHSPVVVFMWRIVRDKARTQIYKGALQNETKTKNYPHSHVHADVYFTRTHDEPLWSFRLKFYSPESGVILFRAGTSKFIASSESLHVIPLLMGIRL